MHIEINLNTDLLDLVLATLSLLWAIVTYIVGFRKIRRWVADPRFRARDKSDGNYICAYLGFLTCPLWVTLTIIAVLVCRIFFVWPWKLFTIGIKEK